MSSTVPSAVPPALLELAGHWQQAGQEWLQWWTNTTTALTSSQANPAFAPTLPQVDPALAPTSQANPALAPTSQANPAFAPALPRAAGISAVDAQALSALNARYQPRFQALWAAAQAALMAEAQSVPMPTVASPSPGDRRFTAAEWNELPYFALLKQYYLLSAEYMNELVALAPLPGAEKQRLRFLTRQAIDALSPTNFPATNPEVIKRALKTEGASLARGFANFVADAQKGRISMTDERAFAVGENLAITPGHVVFRNDLIEVIQYSPSTPQVHHRPLVIVPPCINKYYILDLQPDNSFVRWTVAQGHTVFMISWRNVPAELGHLRWDDYIVDGVLRAIDVAKAVSGSPIVNVLGFCVGGTLLAAALAVLAARRDRSVASVTLLTTLLDFDEPGEIGVYVSRELLASREPLLMAGQRVQGSEIASAFASLRANDLVWNYVVSNYLKGETPPAFDLLYWNSDSANLPGPMYVYYLQNLYLDNLLREPGALTMDGESVDLSRIGIPAYVLATRDDHIVPWHGAYRTIGLLGGDSTFVLGASGHIAGVVNPPAKNRRNFWVGDRVGGGPDDWFGEAQNRNGSWWPHWAAWLAPHAGAMRPAPAAPGNAEFPALDPAPGRYVREAAL